MTSSILSRTAKSAGWVIGWRMATRVLGLISTLILVRLLMPDDFGIVALGAAFAQTVEAMSVLGTDDALVRERAPSRAMYDTAFTMNAIRGALTGTIVAVAAVPIAAYFGEPRLASLLLVLAGLAVLDGFLNVGVVDFRRDFQFHKEFLLNIVPRLVSVAVTIVGAFVYQSFWALVAGQATYRILRLAASYGMHSYRPSLSLVAWRSLMMFSAWSWALAVLQMIQGRIDSFIIGRSLGSSSVGTYALGLEIAILPSSELVDSLGRAAYSGFSATRHEGGTEDLFIRLIATSVVVTWPVALGLSMVADPLVRVALGERWLSVVPIIQVMSFASAVTPFGSLGAMLLRSHGYLKVIATIALVGLIIKILAIGSLLHYFGLPGAAGGAAIAIMVECSLVLGAVFATQDLQLRRLFLCCSRALFACAAMGFVLGALGLAWTECCQTFASSASVLAKTAGLGALVYGISLFGSWAIQGRPDGAEADLARTLLRLAGFLTRWRAGRNALKPLP